MKKATLSNAKQQAVHMPVGRESDMMSKHLTNPVSRSELSLAKSLSPHHSNSLTRDMPATAPLHHHAQTQRPGRGYVNAAPTSSIYSNVGNSAPSPLTMGVNAPPYNHVVPTKKAMVSRKHSGKITSGREHEARLHIGLQQWRSELSLTEPFTRTEMPAGGMPGPPVHHPRAGRSLHPITASASFTSANQANLGTASLNSSPYNSFRENSLSLSPGKKAVLTKKYSQVSPTTRDGEPHPNRFGNGLVSSHSELSLNKGFSSPSSTLSREAPPAPHPLTHSRSHSHHFVKLNENTSLSTSTTKGYDQSGTRTLPMTKPTSDYNSSYTSDSTSTRSNDASDVTGHWSLPHMPSNNGPDYPSAPNGNSVLIMNQVNSKDSDHKREGIYNRHAKSPKVYGQQNLRSGVNVHVERVRVKNGCIKNGSNSSNSSSGSSSSTLQEDLLKLISPEYNLSDTNVDCEASSSSGAETASTPTHYSTPYSSLERSKDDVILTVAAQPAHVISSEPSSPMDDSFEKQKVIVAPLARSPQHSSSSAKSSPAPPPFDLSTLPSEAGEIDWTNLVETATKAMALTQQQGDKQNRTFSATTLEESLAFLNEFGANLPSVVGCASQLPSESVKELENTVKKLQFDLHREQSDKATLEEQVSHKAARFAAHELTSVLHRCTGCKKRTASWSKRAKRRPLSCANSLNGKCARFAEYVVINVCSLHPSGSFKTAIRTRN